MTTTKYAKSPKEVLGRAADLLEKSGWCANSYRNSSGQYCVLAALREVSGISLTTFLSTPEYEKMFNRYTDACSLLEKEVGFITSWNDRHISGENVIKKLREIVAKL